MSNQSHKQRAVQHCIKTRGQAAAIVMLQVFDASIATGIWPQPDSPCHKKLKEIIGMAATPNDRTEPSVR